MDSPPVVFDYNAWVSRYPEFANVTSDQAQGYFDEAALYCDNSVTNPALSILPTLLNMLTAHIAWLYAPRDASGNPSSTGTANQNVVGRVASAAEGSVSVMLQNDYEPGTPQWFQQTRYGASYWAATASYRTAQYIANPTCVPSAVYPFMGRRW